MAPRKPLPLSETWTYALVGGGASIPLTVGAYWLSGMGSHFSLNMVAVGGLIAGYLAARSRSADATAAGVRAGLVGSIPAVAWALSESIPAALGAAGPTPFTVGAVVLALGLGLAAVVIGVVAGLIGGKVGGWLAGKVGRRPDPPSAGSA
ncbi:DUF5518 domain-containing protein [Haloplanus halophilus]|uniref:DUF5518 domain-containing protein n=1 Tax=Haloplanus halophilus TaxID=2949993 RepID=UPI00203D07AB|nr:DUF5518 domain-containing protein [Haloplanus sp. GDY1]